MKITIKSSMIAPCGMNCALCLAFQRQKNRCFGCVTNVLPKMNYCAKCKIRNCASIKNTGAKYCSACIEFPCRLVKHIDKRYRFKYRMSMIENLDFIKNNGIRKFISLEKKRRICTNCGRVICIHRENCLVCGSSVAINLNRDN
jgi:hypothetical protein